MTSETMKQLFSKFIQRLFQVVVLLFVLDGALASGTFLVEPLMAIVYGDGWETTYYGCPTEWIVMDEGSFCDDQ